MAMKRQVQQATRGKVPSWLRSIAVVMIAFGIGWGVFSTITTKSPEATAAKTNTVAAEAQARSGEYRMYDVSDKSKEGAANREKFVQISFTVGGMSFDYPLVESGREIKVYVTGTTRDGKIYFLRHRRTDQDESSSALERCEFKALSGACETPNIVGGLNTTTFTKL